MKFSIVTPTYNSEKFLEETIQSVVSQKGDFTVEYIVVDNYSSDGTIDIIQHYETTLKKNIQRIGCRHVEIKKFQKKDTGMYEAINYGFSQATGDIFAWINSDDIYLPGAFSVIARSLEHYPQIKWIKGITSYIDTNSTIFKAGQCYLYDREWLRKGVYGRDAYFVQQDSVFWRSDLWKAVGGIDTRYKRAGDYSLWVNFSRHTPLYTAKAYLSCFRKVEGQLSQDVNAYRKEMTAISLGRQNLFLTTMIKTFFYYKDKLLPLFLQKFIYRLMFGKQTFFLVESNANEKPVLKAVSYYVAK